MAGKKKKKKEFNTYTCKKCRLDAIIKNKIDMNFNDILIDAINRTNYIVYHTYNFLKIVLINLFNKNEFIKVDKDLIMLIMMNIISIKTNKAGNKISEDKQKLVDKLMNTYNDYKKNININEIVHNDYLNQILHYEAVDMITNIENNIKMHYLQHLYKLAKIIFKETTANFVNFEYKKEIFNDYFNDIINITDNNFKSELRLIPTIKNIKKLYIPIKNKFKKDSIYYDVKVNPQEYLKCFYEINVFFENKQNKNYNISTDIFNNLNDEYNNLIINSFINEHTNLNTDLNTALKKIKKDKNKNNDIKLFNFIPIRRTNIPCHITLDTTALISLYFKEGKKELFENVTENQNNIWSKYFKLENKLFKKSGYEFNYLIKTDGYSVSIVYGKYDPNFKKNNKDTDICELYIEDQNEIHKIFENKNYVTIDPNKEDLIYCLDKNGQKFRYSNNQRKYETQSKRKLKRNEYLKNTTNVDINFEINDQISKKQKSLNLDYILLRKIHDEVYFIENTNKQLNTQYKYVNGICIPQDKLKMPHKTNYNYKIIEPIKRILGKSCITETKRSKKLNKLKKHRKQKPKKQSSQMIKEIKEYINLIENNIYINNIKNLIEEYENDKINENTNKISIKCAESILSNYNSKTNDLTKFMEYLCAKERVNKMTKEFYKDIIHRKNKLDIYSNKNRSEAKMINNFKRKFGTSEETVVIMGDWSEGNLFMKNKEPTINKRIRSLLRRENYKVYMIDEYRTSKLCNHCECEVINGYKRNENDKENVYVWSLLA
jgi:hypothetical protein